MRNHGMPFGKIKYRTNVLGNAGAVESDAFDLDRGEIGESKNDSDLPLAASDLSEGERSTTDADSVLSRLAGEDHSGKSIGMASR
jgi:hypothetical protein